MLSVFINIVFTTFSRRVVDTVKCHWSNFYFYLRHFNIDYFTLHYTKDRSEIVSAPKTSSMRLAVWINHLHDTHTHRVKLRHKIYGHDTIAILWVCVELRGEELSSYLNNIQSVGLWKCRMITILPTKRVSALAQCKTFMRVLPTRWRRKPVSIEIMLLLPYVFKVWWGC